MTSEKSNSASNPNQKPKSAAPALPAKSNTTTASVPSSPGPGGASLTAVGGGQTPSQVAKSVGETAKIAGSELAKNASDFAQKASNMGLAILQWLEQWIENNKQDNGFSLSIFGAVAVVIGLNLYKHFSTR